MSEMLKVRATWVTGSRRGYVHVADRGVESELTPIPATLKGLTGNRRWAMACLRDAGSTHYTVAHYQGVPGKGYSNQFCHTVFNGYKIEGGDENV